LSCVVVYAFRSPGSGAVYIGKHECDPEGWSRRGHGRLPDGYKGSGDVVPRFHARHGDRVEWRILAVVPVADWPRAERRAIHLARLFLGRRCVNVLSGGEGLTSSDAKTMWADPVFRDRHRRSMVETYSDTGMREGLSTMLRDRWTDPAYRDAQCEALRSAGNRPEVRAKRSAATKAHSHTPEGAAHIARMAALNSTPEAIAKRQRTRRANDSWRRLAAERPELFEWA